MKHIIHVSLVAVHTHTHTDNLTNEQRRGVAIWQCQ